MRKNKNILLLLPLINMILMIQNHIEDQNFVTSEITRYNQNNPSLSCKHVYAKAEKTAVMLYFDADADFYVKITKSGWDIIWKG
jgi:hypothetical protein